MCVCVCGGGGGGGGGGGCHGKPHRVSCLALQEKGRLPKTRCVPRPLHRRKTTHWALSLFFQSRVRGYTYLSPQTRVSQAVEEEVSSSFSRMVRGISSGGHPSGRRDQHHHKAISTDVTSCSVINQTSWVALISTWNAQCDVLACTSIDGISSL